MTSVCQFSSRIASRFSFPSNVSRQTFRFLICHFVFFSDGCLWISFMCWRSVADISGMHITMRMSTMLLGSGFLIGPTFQFRSAPPPRGWKINFSAPLRAESADLRGKSGTCGDGEFRDFPRVPRKFSKIKNVKKSDSSVVKQPISGTGFYHLGGNFQNSNQTFFRESEIAGAFDWIYGCEFCSLLFLTHFLSGLNWPEGAVHQDRTGAKAEYRRTKLARTSGKRN